MTRVFFFVLGLLLIACEKRPPNVATVFDAGFSAKGRIGLLSEEGNFSASFLYSASDDVARLELWGPAGSGHMVVTSADGFAALTDGAGNYYQSKDIDALINDHLGYPVPASSLTYWLKGSANPNLSIEEVVRDDNGDMQSLVQRNWSITYRDWVGSNNTKHPEKIKARDESRNIRISIKIDEWDVKK